MSKNFEKVKGYYEKGLWSKSRVYNAVGKWITKEEYRQITGDTYAVDESEGMPDEKNRKL